jgi:hypothetical protein
VNRVVEFRVRIPGEIVIRNREPGIFLQMKCDRDAVRPGGKSVSDVREQPGTYQNVRSILQIAPSNLRAGSQTGQRDGLSLSEEFQPICANFMQRRGLCGSLRSADKAQGKGQQGKAMSTHRDILAKVALD